MLIHRWFMLYHPFPNPITVLFIALSTVVFTSSQTFAQDSPSLDSLPLASGIYSRGVQQIQVVHSDRNICIHGSFDSEVQAQALETIEQIRREATEAEIQLEARLQEDISNRRGQIQALMQDESQLNAAIESGELTSEQRQQIQIFKDNPQTLDAFFEAQANEANQQLRSRVEQQRIEAEERVMLAAGDLLIQGVSSLELEPNGNTYTINGTNLIVMPQENERLLFGQPNNLQEFHLSENVSSPDTLSLQQCLESRQSYSQLTKP
jgi:hypothetical protein